MVRIAVRVMDGHILCQTNVNLKCIRGIFYCRLVLLEQGLHVFNDAHRAFVVSDGQRDAVYVHSSLRLCFMEGRTFMCPSEM